MADNTTLDSGSGGDVIATDDIGGVKYPRGKIVIGADGVNDGDVSASNPLPVKGTGAAGTANAGVVTVQGIASMTPVQVEDNGGTLSVDDGAGSLTVDNATLSVVGGGVEAAALRVTLASDSTGLISVDDNGGSLTVDGTVAATQSGTWTVTGAGGTFPVTDSGGSLTVDGTVAATQSGTWTVTGAGGTFPVTDSGGSLTVDNSTLAVVGGGVEATALRVTIASDSTGLVSVDDNGGSLTVDGTVAATQSGAWTVTGAGGSFPVTDSGGSLTVDAPVGTPVFVQLSDGASPITTLPVSLASVPSHAVTNAGTFAVQVDGLALTSLQLIDDAVATTGSAITAKGLAACGTDGTNARVLKTDASGELQVDVLTMPTVTVTGTVSTSGTSVAQDDLVLVWASNQTTTGTTFPALAQTTTAPTGDGIITMTGRENLALIPFGRNGNNLTLKMRISGWRIIGTEYIATTLAEITCTLSSSLTGRSGGTPSNSDLYCDTITVDKGIAVVLASPADDTGIASVEIPVGPYDLIQVQGIRNGSATEFNALRQTY